MQLGTLAVGAGLLWTPESSEYVARASERALRSHLVFQGALSGIKAIE